MENDLSKLIRAWRKNEPPGVWSNLKQYNKDNLAVEVKDLSWNVHGDVTWDKDSSAYIFYIRGISELYKETIILADASTLTFSQHLTLTRILQSEYGIDFFEFLPSNVFSLPARK